MSSGDRPRGPEALREKLRLLNTGKIMVVCLRDDLELTIQKLDELAAENKTLQDHVEILDSLSGAP